MTSGHFRVAYRHCHGHGPCSQGRSICSTPNVKQWLPLKAVVPAALEAPSRACWSPLRASSSLYPNSRKKIIFAFFTQMSHSLCDLAQSHDLPCSAQVMHHRIIIDTFRDSDRHGVLVNPYRRLRPELTATRRYRSCNVRGSKRGAIAQGC